MRHDPATILLCRLINQQELDVIAASGWLAFPPCLPEQPIFFFALGPDYATQLAHDEDRPHDGVGYVVRFAVDADYVAQFPVQYATDRQQEGLWVPAEELTELNNHIFGQIEVVGVFES
ncbi:MAG TPA: hypothetical protein VF598_12025 [Hymenobacter sp.]